MIWIVLVEGIAMAFERGCLRVYMRYVGVLVFLVSVRGSQQSVIMWPVLVVEFTFPFVKTCETTT
jgi:hypothetical protein